jgi:hypothetical protein
LSNKHKKSDHVPVIKGNDGELKFEDAEKANAMNQYFASVSSVNDNDIMLPVLPNLEAEDMLTTLEIKDEDVLLFLKKLDPNKAYGPDEISPLFLIKAAESLAPIYANLFRMCLRHQIFRKYGKDQMSYQFLRRDILKRLETIGPYLYYVLSSKVFEKVIYKALFNHVRHKISIYQSGFLPNHSTVTHLIELNHIIL